jgi:hypothetical protein
VNRNPPPHGRLYLEENREQIFIGTGRKQGTNLYMKKTEGTALQN